MTRAHGKDGKTLPVPPVKTGKDPSKKGAEDVGGIRGRETP